MMETTRCQHCGQPALETDVTCWHCGRALPGRDPAREAVHSARELWTAAEESSHLSLYLASTAVVLVAIIVVMAALGRRPTAQVRLGTRVPRGWQLFTSHDELFTVTVPGEWQIVESGLDETEGEWMQLTGEGQLYRESTYPLGTEVADLELRFLSGPHLGPDENDPLFMVVAVSRALNGLSIEQAGTALSAGSYGQLEVAVVDNFQKSHLSVQIEPPAGGSTTLWCRQQFIPGQSQALLASLCLSTERRAELASTVEAIMDSFQRLSR